MLSAPPCILKVTRTCVLTALAISLGTAGLAADRSPAVTYLPATQNVEGDQPLHSSYVLSITAPSNVSPGQPVTISPVVSVTQSPAGVPESVALSFITLSPATLVFTSPGQTLTTTVSCDFPLGTAAGDYAYRISTPGWAAGTVDNFATINAKVTLPQATDVPAVSIVAPLDGSTHVYFQGGPPLSIPLQFSVTAPGVSPITSVDADLNGQAVSVSATGLGTGNVTATGTISVASGGLFTLRARATNGVGTSSNTVEFTVIVEALPPPPPPPPQPECRINWLPPISLGKVQKSGSTVAIKFELDCGCEHGVDRDGDGDPDHYPGQRTKSKHGADPAVMIAISEILGDGSIAPPALFSHSPDGKKSGYSIQGGDMYHLNFKTAPGPRRYLIEVFHFPTGAPGPQVIGTKEFTTK